MRNDWWKGVVAAVASTAVFEMAAGGAAGAAERFVDAGEGVRIRVVDVGPGSAPAPSVLFVPGWTLTAEIWQAQIDHFSAVRRSAAMDPRGQGGSSETRVGLCPEGRARDIKAVIDSLQLAPVVLVGWSMAVQEVLSYVDQFGTSSLAGVVLVDGVAGLDWDDERARMMVSSLGMLLRDHEAWVRRFVPTMFRTPRSSEYFAAVEEASLRTPAPVAVALSIASMTADLRPALAKIDRPTLIVVTPGPFAIRFAEMRSAIPLARLEVFEDAGHALFVDEPERFNALLGAFIDGLQPPR